MTAADTILIIHSAWVAFVVGAVPFILIGGRRGWGWIRNSWFRNIHLVMMTIVFLEAILGIPCPLTIGEQALREAEDGGGYEGSFTAHLLSRIIFVELPDWMISLLHTSWGILVFWLYYRYPPRRALFRAGRKR